MTARKVGDHVELPKDEARAGQTSGHVRIILLVSIALVLVGFGVLGAAWFGGAGPG
jgi:hypothetical protein